MERQESSQLLKTVQLRLPELKKEQIIGHVSALRPFRKGGVRFEEEQQGDLRILHNYGHGTWGVNMSYGTAVRIVDLFELRQRAAKYKDTPVIVLGSGVVGLCTALVLLERGYRVKIVAQDFPKANSYDAHTKHATEPLVTSQVAAGFIVPFSEKIIAGQVTDCLVQDKFTKLEVESVSATQQFMQRCIQEKRLRGLRYQNYYEFLQNPYESPGFSDDSGFVNVSFGVNTLPRRAHLSKIIIADTQYLFSLQEEVQKLGAQFLKRKLSKNDLQVETLGSDVLFNCCGLGAIELFDDLNVYPIKGQLIYLQKQKSSDDAPPQEDFTLIADSPDNHESSEIQYFSHEDKIVLGGVFQTNVWSSSINQKNIDDIWRRYQNFREQALSQKAKL